MPVASSFPVVAANVAAAAARVIRLQPVPIPSFAVAAFLAAVSAAWLLLVMVDAAITAVGVASDLEVEVAAAVVAVVVLAWVLFLVCVKEERRPGSIPSSVAPSCSVTDSGCCISEPPSFGDAHRTNVVTARVVVLAFRVQLQDA